MWKCISISPCDWLMKSAEYAIRPKAMNRRVENAPGARCARK